MKKKQNCHPLFNKLEVSDRLFTDTLVTHSGRLNSREKRVDSPVPNYAIALLSGALILFTAKSVDASDEAGAEGVGADTLNVAAGEYGDADGIFYDDSDGLTLTLDNAGINLTGSDSGVSILSSASNINDIVVNANNFGIIETTNDGGASAFGNGLLALNNGTAGNAVVNVGGGSITTTGVNADGALALINNAAATGNAVVTMTDGSITTVTGKGLSSINNGLGNATATFSGGSIVTTGLQGYGVYADSGATGSTGSALAQMTGGSLTTSGDQVYGVVAMNRALGTAHAQLDDGTIVMSGVDSIAVYSRIYEFDSTALASSLMTGGSIETSGTGSSGVRSENNGLGDSFAHLLDGEITMSGATSVGVLAIADHSTTTDDLTGDGHALAQITNGSISLTGDSSIGIEARVWDTGLAEIRAEGGTVSATGDNSTGLFARSQNGNTRIYVNTEVTGGSGTGYAIRTTTSLDMMSTMIVDSNAVLSALSGNAISNNQGDSYTEIRAGAQVAGAIRLGNGDDTLNILSGADISNITEMDGGDDTSVADGFIDTLNLNGITASRNGTDIINWEVVNLVDSSLTILDGALAIGDTTDQSTGLFLQNSTLDAGDALAFDGNINIDADSSFVGTGGGAGVYTISGDVVNNGLITTVDDLVGDMITIDGNYSGNGRLEADVDFATDLADQLTINGDITSGTTIIMVNDVSSGAATGNDLLLVTVNGLTSDTDFNFNPIATSDGVLTYSLERNGNQWLLTAEQDGYAPQVPIEEVYPRILLDSIGGAGINAGGLPTMQQRIGNRGWSDSLSTIGTAGLSAQAGAKASDASIKSGMIEDQGIWARVEGNHRSVEPSSSTSGVTDYDVNQFQFQAGKDFLIHESANGSHILAGITAHFGNTRADIDSTVGAGLIEVEGHGFGGTLTWLDVNGMYLDLQGVATWFNSDLSSDEVGEITRGNDGFGYAVSAEFGKQFDLRNEWTTTPQVQLAYAEADFDNYTGALDESVSLGKAESLRLRLGITADREKSWVSENGAQQRTHFYTIANLIHEFKPTTEVVAASSSLKHQIDDWTVQLGVGMTRNFDDDRYSIYGELNTSSGLDNFGDTYSIGGTVGVRFRF